MLIQKILISPIISEKIKCRHGLDPVVSKDILGGNCYIEKVGGDNYMAIGLLELLRSKLHTRHQIGRLIFIREKEDDYEKQKERN